MLFAMQLGDLIDARNRHTKSQEKALQTVLKELDTSSYTKLYHVLGNHELYNFDRKTLTGLLDMKQPEFYYSFQPIKGWRCIVLDAFDISILGLQETDEKYKEAVTLLKKNNPNDVFSNNDWLQGLSGVQRRWLPYNGAISTKQLDWIEKELKEATELKERVLIFCHVPIYLPATHVETLIWNYDLVLQKLQSFKNVIAFIAGHDHDGGYAIDKTGIIHITLSSPLETTIKQKVAYGYIQIFHDHFILKGYGSVSDRKIMFS